MFHQIHSEARRLRTVRRRPRHGARAPLARAAHRTVAPAAAHRWQGKGLPAQTRHGDSSDGVKRRKIQAWCCCPEPCMLVVIFCENNQWRPSVLRMGFEGLRNACTARFKADSTANLIVNRPNNLTEQKTNEIKTISTYRAYSWSIWNL